MELAWLTPMGYSSTPSGTLVNDPITLEDVLSTMGFVSVSSGTLISDPITLEDTLALMGFTGNATGTLANDPITLEDTLGSMSFAAQGSYNAYLVNTVLQMDFSGTNGATTFSELTGKTITRGGQAVLSNAQYYESPTSLYLNGTDQTCIYTPASNDFNFGSGDFTVEMRIRPTTSGFSRLLYIYNTSINGYIFGIYLNGTSINGSISADNKDDGDGTKIGSGCNASGININQWNHIAFVRSGNNLQCFVNGVGGSITTWAYSMASNLYPLYIGARYLAGQAKPIEQFTGYIDNLRITKGVCRYTSNFDPNLITFV